MTVPTNLGNGWLIGISSDSKPTTFPAGTRMFQTDDYKTYVYNGSAWVILPRPHADVTKVTGDSPYSILITDEVIRANASSGALTVTLPTAVGKAGQVFVIRRVDILASTVLVVVATTSSQTIGGAANEYLAPAECIVVESDNANWEVLARTAGGYYLQKNSTNNRRYPAGFIPGTTAPTTASTTLPATDTLWALPFGVLKTTKFDTITFRVTTVASAGGVAMAGIYRDNGNTYPGALIFDTGSIATDSGTSKDTTITAGLQVFPAGLYWLAWQCRVAAPQIRIISGSTNVWNILGSDSGLATANTGFGYSVANAANALPDPYTASATVLTSPSVVGIPIPYITLRAI